MATQANFAAAPRTGCVLVNTANTNTDGLAGTRATVLTAGANGTRVDTLKIKGIVAEGATQAADTVRIWVNNGANAFLLQEQLVAAGAGVVSATVANVEFLIPLGLQLPSGYSLQLSTHAGGATASYHGTAVGGDY